MEEGAALRVAEDDPGELEILELVEAGEWGGQEERASRKERNARDLSGVGSGGELVGVLSGNSDLLRERSISAGVQG